MTSANIPLVDVIDGTSFDREPAMACPLCAADLPARRIDVRFGMFASVAYCDACRLGYQTPRPSEEASAAYMNSRWRSADHYVTDNEPKRAEARKQLRLIRRDFPDASAIMDFGAGSGMFVKACLDAGLDAVGVEQSASAIARAREIVGVDLIPRAPDATFDLVTLWDVVEHLRDPEATLREIRGRLRPGGSVVLETGNYESWQRTFSGDRWGLYLLDHQYYFTPSSLERMAKAAGFQSFHLLDAGHSRPSVRPWAYDRNPLKFLKAWNHYRGAMKRWPGHGDIGVMIGVATA